MWHAADGALARSCHSIDLTESITVVEKVRNAKHYSFDIPDSSIPDVNWPDLKHKRDEYVKKLNGIYYRNSEKAGIDIHMETRGRLAGPHTVEMTGKDGSKRKITGQYITVAVGGAPTLPSIEGGKELGITSDGFFELVERPNRVAVVGAGYIAVEMTGFLHTLGAEAHLLIRHDRILRPFDPIIKDTLQERMVKTGIHVHQNVNVTKVTTKEKGPYDLTRPFPKTVHLDNGETIEVDTVLFAIGRKSSTDDLGLDTVGVTTDKQGNIPVDKYQRSNVDYIHAIGDVQGKALLTPVAIAAGRKLSNRLFGGPEFKDDYLDYENVRRVVHELRRRLTRLLDSFCRLFRTSVRDCRHGAS